MEYIVNQPVYLSCNDGNVSHFPFKALWTILVFQELIIQGMIDLGMVGLF